MGEATSRRKKEREKKKCIHRPRNGCDSKSRAVKKGTKEGKKGKGEREREMDGYPGFERLGEKC